jgi:N-acetylneuraminic acid mutarotase
MSQSYRNAAILFCSVLAACGTPTSDSTEPGAGLSDEPNAVQSTSVLAASNTWMQKRSLMPWRMYMAAGTINGVIYVVGGRGREDATLRRVDAYNVSTNTWSQVAPLPGARAHPNGASMINGKLYVTGGSNRDDKWTKTLFVYDPRTNSWTRKADMPRTSCDGDQGVIGGQLYVYTGCNASTNAGAVFFRYNPTTDSWVKRAAPPTDHANGAGTAVGGRFYLAGGYKECTECGEPGIFESSYDHHAYNPATNSWTTKAQLGVTRVGMAAAAMDGKLWFAGGIGWEFQTDEVRVYDPMTNMWTTKASMPIKATNGAAAMAGGKLFYIAGLEWLEPGDTPSWVYAYTP